MSYYIDGTIDSIEIAMDNNLHLHFTLLPSSEFLKTVEEGKRKALFIEVEEPKDKTTDDSAAMLKRITSNNPKATHALLVAPIKNESGKEMLRFEMPKSCVIFRGLLLEAKNYRNTVRVFVKPTTNEFGENTVDLDNPVSITIL